MGGKLKMLSYPKYWQ